MPGLRSIGSAQSLLALHDHRRAQTQKKMAINHLANAPPNGGFTIPFDRLMTNQRALCVLMILNVVIAPAFGKPLTAARQAGRNEYVSPISGTRSIARPTEVTSLQENAIDSQRIATTFNRAHRALHPVPPTGSQRVKRTARETARNGHPSQIASTRLQSTIQQSFARSGDSLGDRIAEGVVMRLPGWPADRHLQIVEPDPNGDWKPIRTYPAMGNGKPVRLYLREDGVYVAIAEPGSPFGDGAQIAEPRDEQRGDSFYIALQHALFPDQRAGMGIEPWNENNIGKLRAKVHGFSIDHDNRDDMARLFNTARADTSWREAIQSRVRTYRAPSPLETSTSTTAKSTDGTIACRPSVRVERIGPVNPERTIACHLYVHQDMPLGENRMLSRYFQWWLDEMTPLLPANTGLQLKIFHDVPGCYRSGLHRPRR